MQSIFKMEFHPINKHPRRIRFLLESDTDRIVRVEEEKSNGSWEEVDSEVVSYLEYSDEDHESQGF